MTEEYRHTQKLDKENNQWIDIRFENLKEGDYIIFPNEKFNKDIIYEVRSNPFYDETNEAMAIHAVPTNEL